MKIKKINKEMKIKFLIVFLVVTLSISFVSALNFIHFGDVDASSNSTIKVPLYIETDFPLISLQTAFYSSNPEMFTIMLNKPADFIRDSSPALLRNAPSFGVNSLYEHSTMYFFLNNPTSGNFSNVLVPGRHLVGELQVRVGDVPIGTEACIQFDTYTLPVCAVFPNQCQRNIMVFWDNEINNWSSEILDIETQTDRGCIFVTSSESEIHFIRGDVNLDGRVDIADAIYLLSYLFGSQNTKLNCMDSADANDDGKIDIADAIRILAYLFSGIPLQPPSPTPGSDPTEDDLDCSCYPQSMCV